MDPRFKVAIPRLERREPERKEPDKHRVVKACNSCRKRKVKCSGENPRCRNCIESKSTCIYPQARKDRLKEATEHNTHLIALLKDLKLRVNDKDKQRIDDVLERAKDDHIVTSNTKIMSPTLGKRPRNEIDLCNIQEESPGEANVSGSVGSNEDVDLLDEDLLRNPESRATGFRGQNSEVQWLRSFKMNMGSPVSEKEDFQFAYGPPGTSDEAVQKRINAKHARMDTSKLGRILHVNDSNFYLDADHLEVDEFLVEPYQIPPDDTARALFQCYMDKVHSSFPILPELFEKNFEQYFELARMSQSVSVITKFQGILNLIFAIGAKYSHLTKADWATDERDHLLYMTRAIKLLGLNDTLNLIVAPDLGLIQATGLLSFYYLAIGHVSRAWVMIGVSIRFALAVGLHLRNEDTSIPSAKKEHLIQIWWALQSIECLLSAITGRPCVISNDDCTVPLPHSFPEEGHSPMSVSADLSRSPNTSIFAGPLTKNNASYLPSLLLYFHAGIKVGFITQKALAELYSPRTATLSWERIQKVISLLLSNLEEWAVSTVPRSISSLTYESIHNLDSNPVSRSIQREQLLLAMNYQSLKLQITRPCLCRMENRIKGQSDTSVDFNNRIAASCVQAAEDMTKLFPDEPDEEYIYEQGPWWCIIHYIMQAIAVFLLEIAYQAAHTGPNRRTEILWCIKKLLKWLRCLMPENPVAERANKVVLDILKGCPEGMRRDFSDILADEFSESFRNHPDSPTQNSFYDWNLDPQSRLSATMHPNMSMLPHIQYLGSIENQGVEGAYDSNGSGESNAESGDKWWSGDLGFQLPSTYGNPFQTTFDQVNPLSTSLDELYGIYLDDLPDDDAQQQQG